MAKTLKLSQNLMTFLQSFVFFERPSLAKISVEQIALSYSTKPPVPFNIIITLVKLDTSHHRYKSSYYLAVFSDQLLNSTFL